MKSIMALFLALIAANFAVAHGSHGAQGGEGSGLSAGLGFGMHIHQEEDETEFIPNAELSLSYSESFFDDKLDFDIGVSYIPTFTEGFFEIAEDYPFSNPHFHQQVICLNGGLAYRLDLSYFTSLSFMAENDTDFYIAPREDGQNNTEGVVTPGIKLNWNSGIGALYVQYGLPLQYVFYFKTEEWGIGSDLTIGWESKFGLGINFTGHYLMSPESGFDSVDAVIAYAVPIKKFLVYVNCEFEGIGSEEGMHIVPAAGFRYNF